MTSRSNQNEITNPCTRWMEWNGEKGNIRYYDKEKKERVELPNKIQFLLLDQLATVKGWDDSSDSGIYANEVKDTATQPLNVKSFKGGVIAAGIYKDIRDKVVAAGGHFVSNLYISAKIDGELQIASMQFKGASLNAWIEFAKANRKDLFKKAIVITGVETGKKGSITYQIPVFGLNEVSEETDNIAKALDIELQDYLKKYFAKTVNDQVVDASHEEVVHTPNKIEPNRAVENKKETTIEFNDLLF